jgi:large subunit ribosomal protein L23
MNLHNVIIAPVITEKSETSKNPGKNVNRYTLKVHADANKELIRQALYKIYKVNAVKVNTSVVPGKNKRFGQHKARTSTWKKAMVTLAPGESIEFTR